MIEGQQGGEMLSSSSEQVLTAKLGCYELLGLLQLPSSTGVI